MPITLNKQCHKTFYYVTLGVMLSLSAQAGEKVATVVAVTGKANAGGRALSRAAALFQGDTISTEPGSKVKFKFTDGSVITLAEKTSYVIKNYSFSNGKKQDTFQAQLLKGGLKNVTGKIGKEAARQQEANAAGVPKTQQTSNANYKMQAGLATIGVRGTNYNVGIEHEATDAGPPFGLSMFKELIHQSFEESGDTQGTVYIHVNSGSLGVDTQQDFVVVGDEAGIYNAVVDQLGNISAESYNVTADWDTDDFSDDDDDDAGDDTGDATEDDTGDQGGASDSE